MSRIGSLSEAIGPSIEWAGVILTNPEGQLLLNLRGPEKQLAPDCWDVVGGTLEPGETPETCLFRELQEESGETDVAAVWFRDYDLPLPDGGFGRLHVFSAALDKPAAALVVGEGVEHRFFAPQALAALNLPPGMAQVLREFIESSQYQARRYSGVSASTSR